MPVTRRLFVTAMASTVIATVIAIVIFRSDGEPALATPLTEFSAPFVYGRFNVPKANPLTVEAVALGRRLFYDVRLSASNSISCGVQSIFFGMGAQIH